MMKKIIFLFFVFFALTSESFAVQNLRIGIETSILLSRERPLVEETLEAIRKRMNRTIIVKSFSGSALKTAVENNEVDLFISTGSFFSAMGRSGVRDLATAVSDRAYDPNHGRSAAVLIRAGDSSLQELDDLEGKKLFFNPRYGEEVLFLLFGELKKHSQNSVRQFEAFERELIQENLPTDQQLDGLLRGKWDAAILPACQLETESEKIRLPSLGIEVLSPKIHSNLRCVHSTALYPNITIATLPSVSASISRELSTILLAMPPNRQGMLWGTASDFSGIDQVLRSIDRDAHASERKWSFSRVLSEYWFLFLGVISMILGLLAHSIRSDHLVLKRTAQLTVSLQKQEQLKKQAVITEEKLGKLQRLGTISQMSSLFAHELRQPLNAIRCYTYSLNRLAKKNQEKIDLQKFSQGLDEISEQVLRADEIIQKVRDYVKNKSSTPKVFDFKALLLHTIKIFEISHAGCRFDLSGVSDAEVYGEPLEVELILSNLIKNAYEAALPSTEPQIFISAVPTETNALLICIWDNGPEISEDQLQLFDAGLKSTKPDGLGLGLSIVRTFVEKSGGKLALSKSHLGGLQVQFTLPTFTDKTDRIQ